MKLRCVASACLLTASMASGAATTTTTLGVHATLVSGCQVGAAPIAFGTYSPGAGALASTSLITMSCTTSTVFAVGLSAGSTPGASMAQRLLANGSHTLEYNLYTSSAHTSVWGDGSGSTAVEFGIGNGTGAPVTFTLYGQLPDNATNRVAASGGYSDTILVVISY